MAKNKSSEIPHYELLYIVPNNYTEDEVKGIKANVDKLIADQGGKITHEEYWGKKKFCFPIKHGQHGYYLLSEFDMEAANLAKVNTELRMSHEVLRHMIVTKTIMTEKQAELERKRQEALIAERAAKKEKKEESSRPAPVKEAPKEAPKKLSAQELDDKLDKILETDDLL